MPPFHCRWSHLSAEIKLKMEALSSAEAVEICNALEIPTYKLTLRGFEGWKGGGQWRMKGGGYIRGVGVSEQWQTAEDNREI